MRVTKRGKSWFVADMPDGEPDCGPYLTKAEAESDMRGMERFFRDEHKRNFLTCEPPKQIPQPTLF